MENKIVVAVKGILLKDGRALIMKRADDDDIGGGTWEFSGGKLEFGESPEEALKGNSRRKRALMLKSKSCFMSRRSKQIRTGRSC